MPHWTPEGNITMTGDDEMRSAAKWCQLLYDAHGYVPSPFPEGVAPFPGDDLQRLYEKIVFLQNDGAMGSGAGGTTPCVPPTIPGDLQALAAGALVLDVSWTDNANNETGYNVRWRNLTTGGAFVNAPSEPADATTATVDTTGGASDGDNIEVQVQAAGVGCNSEWISDTVIVTDTN